MPKMSKVSRQSTSRLFLSILLCLLAFTPASQAYPKPYDPFFNPEDTIVWTFQEPHRNRFASFLSVQQKTWTKQEKAIVGYYVELIFKEHPFLRPSGAPLMELIRIKSLGDGTKACTLGRRIGITDLFFAPSLSEAEQKEIVLHELVHSFDLGGRFSDSAQWCNLVCPRMQRYYSYLSTQHDKKKMDQHDLAAADLMASSVGLSNSAAPKSPSESFAYLMTDHLKGKQVAPDIQSYLDQVIASAHSLSQSNSNNHDRRFALACQAMSDMKYSEAEELFRACLRERESQTTHHWMAVLYWNTKQYDSCWYHSERALFLLQQHAVPLACRDRANCNSLATHAEALVSAQQ